MVFMKKKYIIFKNKLKIKDAWGGGRTHEADALVLKTNPFDHSGTHASNIVCCQIFKSF